jgi:hypothetical protein
MHEVHHEIGADPFVSLVMNLRFIGAKVGSW